MAQFHPFPNLPKELRDSIWDMAIRSDDPGVHFFTIYDACNDPPSVVNPSKRVHVTEEPFVVRFRIGFAAPRPRRQESNQLSWTDGNLSTYLTDSGLWTACHQSRERMLRHFRPSETSPQISQKPLDERTVEEICKKPTASINMGFISDNSERQYLTIRPTIDLICLQLPENSNISWDSDDHWESIQDFPLFRWHGDGGYWHSSYIKNIAAEYNPAWETFDPKKDLGPFRHVSGFRNVDEVHGLETFWFIDYRLTRKYKSDDCKRQTFRAGKLTFIEVDWGDWEWCSCPKEGWRCLGGCDQNPAALEKFGAHALVDELEPYETEDDDGSMLEYTPGADMRVLACVDLDSEGELPTREEWYEMCYSK